jgi:formylglycine-generating enzyme required for sulfatase activity
MLERGGPRGRPAVTQPDEFYIGEALRWIVLGPVVADGNEASVHEVVDDRGRLAKVYRALSPQTRDKLVHMVEIRIDSPPHAGIAWPRALLRDTSGAVRGYTMDHFRGMYPLPRAYHAPERQGLPIRLTFHDLARAASNIAHVVSHLHGQGVVVGDLDDANLLLGPGGDIALLDAASFELEGAGTPISDDAALAVLLFRLLMEGSDPLSEDSRRTRVEVDQIAPALWENLTPELRDAFTRTFEEGHDQSEHGTTARDWHALLDAYCLRLHGGCPTNPEHYFLGDSCPWCAQRAPESGERERDPGLDQEGSPSRHRARSRRIALAALLATGVAGAWYVAGRLHRDDTAPPSSPAPAAPVPPPAKRDAVIQAPEQPTNIAAPQISCGASLIDVPQAEGRPPPPCPAGMVGVPGGPFVAGCTTPDCGRAAPCSLHDVRPFCIAATETSVRDYGRCVEDDRIEGPDGACEEPSADDASTYAAELPRRPVNMVSWRDAVNYCAWLSTTRAFDGWTTRLPTADEWEKAARGAKGAPYAWGAGERPEAANLQGNDDSPYTANVGRFAADRSPYGALDMTGNVSEWVSDANAGRASVMGGSFASSLGGARAWTTRQVGIDAYAADIGFRCVAVRPAP